MLGVVRKLIRVTCINCPLAEMGGVVCIVITILGVVITIPPVVITMPPVVITMAPVVVWIVITTLGVVVWIVITIVVLLPQNMRNHENA